MHQVSRNESNTEHTILRNLWEKKCEQWDYETRDITAKKKVGSTNNTVLEIVNGKRENPNKATKDRLASALELEPEEFDHLHKEAVAQYVQIKYGFASRTDVNENAATEVNSLPDETSAGGISADRTIGKPERSYSLSGAAFGGLLTILVVLTTLFISFTGHFAGGRASISDQTKQNYCTLVLNKIIPRRLDCGNQGEFSINGKFRDSWHTKISNIIVPDGWRVMVYYETWLAPDYKTDDPLRKGYVRLQTGNNHLDSMSYAAYHDLLFSDFKRVTDSGELNDKAQFMIIEIAGSGELLVKNHDQKNHDDALTIALVE